MTKQNISSLIATDGVIEAAFELPAMKIKARSAKRPSLDTAIKCVLQIIEDLVAAHIASAVEPIVQEMYDTQVMLVGERDESDDVQDWDDAMDELLEEAISPYNEMLSADWLAKATIGSALHEENAIQEFADSLGREYYNTLIHDNEERKPKSAAKIMSSAGITQAQVETALALHNNNPTEEEKENMETTDNSELQAVIDKAAAHLGDGYDELTIYDDLDLVSDEDDGLAFGAGARLGLEEQDVRVLQALRLEHEGDTPDILHKLLEAAVLALKDGKKPKKAPLSKKIKESEENQTPAPKKGKKSKKEEPADKPESVIDGTVLSALKMCGGNDSELAQAIGVSRATYNSYANGKVDFALTETQEGVIREAVVTRLNVLHEALAKIDGGEPEVVL